MSDPKPYTLEEWNAVNSQAERERHFAPFPHFWRAEATVEALFARVAELEGEPDWRCPECGSFDVDELHYKDDFGSKECNACGYKGQPGEDFPTTTRLVARVAELEAERDRLRERRGRCEKHKDEPGPSLGHDCCEVERLRELIRHGNEQAAPLPCGHPAACVESSDEGTSFCRWCEDVGRLVNARGEACLESDTVHDMADQAELIRSKHARILRLKQERDEVAEELAGLRRAIAARNVERGELGAEMLPTSARSVSIEELTQERDELLVTVKQYEADVPEQEALIERLEQERDEARALCTETEGRLSRECSAHEETRAEAEKLRVGVVYRDHTLVELRLAFQLFLRAVGRVSGEAQGSLARIECDLPWADNIREEAADAEA